MGFTIGEIKWVELILHQRVVLSPPSLPKYNVINF